MLIFYNFVNITVSGVVLFFDYSNIMKLYYFKKFFFLEKNSLDFSNQKSLFLMPSG